MAALAQVPRMRFFTAGGIATPVFPLVGGFVYFYEAGTSTPKDTFTDNVLSIPNTNPIHLNARGETPFDVWLAAGSYKMKVTNALGVQQGDVVDNIAGGEGSGTQLEGAFQEYEFVAALGQTTFVTGGYTPGAIEVHRNGVLLGVDPADYTAADGVNVIIPSAAQLDEISIVAFGTFTVADVYARLSGKTSPVAGAGMVAYSPLINYSPGTIGYKLRSRTSVEDFGAYGDGSITTAAFYIALTAAWDSAIANGHDLEMMTDGAVYDCGIENFPFRQSDTPAVLLDCGNLTIWCSPTVTLCTTSVLGADVLQLNGLKNFHIKGFPKIKASISGATAGSNGCSVTGGFDNITLELDCENLPSLDAATYIDGGKALTIQSGVTVNECGTLRAIVLAEGCAEGFGFEPDLAASLTKKTSIDVDITARNCYAAVKMAAAPASGVLNANMDSGLRVRGKAIDCQHALLINRLHGGEIDIHVASTKTAAAKRLNPSSVGWIAGDTVVDGMLCATAHNAILRMHGNVGACDYKARIGALAAGASGLSGATTNTRIDLDLGGTAASADILEVDVGGNTMTASQLYVSSRTATALPAVFHAAPSNRIRIGCVQTGSFTGTLTGCTTSPAGSIEYSIEGDVVTLEIPTTAGTSNATTATITGMPAMLWPASPQVVIARTTNNGSDAISALDIGSDGVLTLYIGASLTFTNSGTKGIKLSTVVYRRS